MLGCKRVQCGARRSFKAAAAAVAPPQPPVSRAPPRPDASGDAQCAELLERRSSHQHAGASHAPSPGGAHPHAARGRSSGAVRHAAAAVAPPPRPGASAVTLLGGRTSEATVDPAEARQPCLAGNPAPLPQALQPLGAPPQSWQQQQQQQQRPPEQPQPQQPQQPLQQYVEQLRRRRSAAAAEAAAAAAAAAAVNGAPGPPVGSDAQLTRAILLASSWWEVQQLYAAQEGRLNAIHVATMLQRLTALYARRHAAPPLQRHEVPDYLELLRVLFRTAEALLPAMTSRELPGLLCAAAWLRCCPGRAWVCSVLTHVHRHMHPRSKDPLTPQGLALAAWALARLGMRMHSNFRVRWQERVVEGLPRTCHRALALHMYALARLGCAPEESFLQPWLAAAAGRMRYAAGQDVANMLWGVARLRLHLPPEWLAACTAQLARLLAPNDRGPRISDAELAVCLWAMHKLACAPPPALLDAVWAFSGGRMHAMGPCAQATLVYALALHGAEPPAPWLEAFLLRSGQQMRAFGPRGLATLAYALALLRVQPPGGWREALLAALQRVAPQVQPQGWEMLGSAFCMLGWRLPPMVGVGSTRVGVGGVGSSRLHPVGGEPSGSAVRAPPVVLRPLRIGGLASAAGAARH